MEHRRIIKQGPVVFATHEDGSVSATGVFSQGLFVADTRFLSTFQLYINGLKPHLLGSTESSTEDTLNQSGFLHTNDDLTDVPARSLGILQRNSIEGGNAKIQLAVTNWTSKPAHVELAVEVDADFFDSFEARGVKRTKRGQSFEPVAGKNDVVMKYVGLDNITRSTKIISDPAMDRFQDGKIFFDLPMNPNSYREITLEVECFTEVPEGAPMPYAPQSSGAPQPPWFGEATKLHVSNRVVQNVLDRSIEDLRILMTEFPDLWVPSAGLPRFAVPFGRDSMFTGLETLVWNPHILHDVLRFLAHVQGTEENPYNYEQPGKILHEMHTGELANLREIPFGRFYGSVDSTVLFLMAAAEYVIWTGDLGLYHEIKPNLDAAWKWVDDYGEMDGSGYVQYKAHTPPKMAGAALTVGLFNQGWKDSANSVSYADGTMVSDHPVALAEVQGYLYRALQLWGDLYRAMPAEERMSDEGEKLLKRAAVLKERFNREFWMPEKQFYAMALDGHHRQVDTLTSNPGHCLWTGLIAEEHAAETAKTLLSGPMASSWGIRTMANNEKAYNPLSYHNGSVWPFENTLIGAGLQTYGYTDESAEVFDVLLDASSHFEYGRWPEVYCGVQRDLLFVLALQPDASRPQAWSAGAIFLWVQTWLGITPHPFSKRVDISPALPPDIDRITAENLSIAGSHLSLAISRMEDGSTAIQISKNPDGLEVTIRPMQEQTHPELVPA